MGKVSRKRFRKVILPREQLGPRSHAWAEALSPIYMSWKARQLTDAETAALYLVVSLQFWFEGEWVNGPDPLGIDPIPDSRPLPPWLDMDRRTRKRVNSQATIAELINNYSFKAIRRDARIALARWMSDEIQLTLTDGIPAPSEVLTLQVEGRRLVSALFKAEEIDHLVHDGRDALSFLLHDLGHAQKFFGGGLEPDAQIGCYRLLKQALDAGKFDLLSRLDPGWEDRLHYLIADINSHPVHILGVFWAMVRETFLKGSTISEFEKWREDIYEMWNWEDALHQAHVRVIKDQCHESAALISEKLKTVPAGAGPRRVQSSV